MAEQSNARYYRGMIILKLPEAQQELPSLAEKALHGEEVFIEVGERKLRLAPTAAAPASGRGSPRPGRGTWKGRVTIPDAFYEPWDAEEMGAQDG